MAMLLTTTSKINALKEFMKEGDYDSAVEIAEKIRPEKVSSVRDLTTIANAFLKKKRYEDAKDIYIEMHNHAQTHKVLVGLIELCLKTNSPEEAEIYIREFRKLEPDNPERLIYRYRVDVMLGKGPEYLVRSLSKLKDEDYTETWGLELAKAYYKMEDYEKCAQECKDILLWFSGTEAASKARVLLNACTEKGVKVSMPVAKPKAQEPEEESFEAEPVAAPVEEEEAKAEETAEADDGFFDLSAAIGEVVSETIEEDAKAEEQSVKEAAEEAEEASEAVENTYDEADLEAVEDIKFSFAEEGAEGEAEETDTAEAPESYDTFFEEEPEEAAVAENAVETDEEPETAEETGETVPDTFFEEEPDEADVAETVAENTEEPETAEETEEAVPDTFFEEEPDEVPVVAAVKEEAPAALEGEAEAAEESEDVVFDNDEDKAADDTLAEDVTVDIDIIALAMKKAKEADDDDDDVVLHDYYTEEELKEAEWEEAVAAAERKSKSAAAANASKPFYIPPLKYNTPESILSGSDFASKTSDSTDGIPTISAPTAEPKATDDLFDRVPGPAKSVVKNTEKPAKMSEEDFLKGVSASVDNILAVNAEEEDGQMSFFTDSFDRGSDSVSMKPVKADDEDEDFFDISNSIADTVKEDIENGEKETEVSAAPTKRFAEDFTAQALDAALRDDDDAIEKALYGLLSEK